jgi:gamma-glutamyltranspeptidase
MSATPSDGSWRSPVIPGLGIVPSARGTQSRPDPRHPSGVAPGKRPRLTPNPAIAVRDDGSVVPFGAPGGDVQVQAMLQVFLNAFHFGMDIQEAIEQPRFATFSFPNSFAPCHRPPTPGRPFDVFAVYCRNELALSQTTAWTDAAGPNDPKVQARPFLGR